MPSKAECIEDFLAQIEERFYSELKAESFADFLGGTVKISYSVKPRVTIEIREVGKSGPRKGSKFKPKIGPTKKAMRAMNEDTTEEF